MRILFFLSIASLFALGSMQAAAKWEGSAIAVKLPLFVREFQGEVRISLKDNCVEIDIPRKDPSFWLEPHGEDSDAKIGVLLRKHVDFKTIMAVIKEEYPRLKSLYESLSYFNDRYPLEEHTLRVLTQFNLQKKFYNLSTINCSHVTTDIESLLTAIIFVHDIGKPLGAGTVQHENTIPIARYALHRWGFSEAEINFATVLIDNDLFGELSQDDKYEITLEEAFERLTRLSQVAGLPVADYLKLQMLFFVADATSYYTLRKSVFSEKNGYLLPKSKRFLSFFARYAPERKPVQEVASSQD